MDVARLQGAPAEVVLGRPNSGDAHSCFKLDIVRSSARWFLAACEPAPGRPLQTAPDNTKVNKRDRAEGAVTADQQKENAPDRELADEDSQGPRRRRGALDLRPQREGDRPDGKVTLKGPCAPPPKRPRWPPRPPRSRRGQRDQLLSIAPDRQDPLRNRQVDAGAFASFHVGDHDGRQADIRVRHLSVHATGRECRLDSPCKPASATTTSRCSRRIKPTRVSSAPTSRDQGA